MELQLLFLYLRYCTTVPCQQLCMFIFVIAKVGSINILFGMTIFRYFVSKLSDSAEKAKQTRFLLYFD